MEQTEPNIDNRQTEQVLETNSELSLALAESQKGGVAKPLAVPKKGRGRPVASYIYSIPGKGKVPIAEYKAWQKAQKKAEKLAENIDKETKEEIKSRQQVA
jgi:predicted transcriptional regulator